MKRLEFEVRMKKINEDLKIEVLKDYTGDLEDNEEVITMKSSGSERRYIVAMLRFPIIPTPSVLLLDTELDLKDLVSIKSLMKEEFEEDANLFIKMVYEDLVDVNVCE